MRRLIYVPIIHTEADLGSLATEMEERAEAIIGSKNVEKHKEIVNRYWQEIARYWQDKAVHGFKIFQDGMLADGVVGRHIVQRLASQGSINHQIIERLIENGAELIQTEDQELLKEEYLLTIDLTKNTSTSGNLEDLFRYQAKKDSILHARDAYIAQRITTCLAEGETGICFLGAYHQLRPYLAKDITVLPLKDPKKVKAYTQKYPQSKWAAEAARLGQYLVEPIKSDEGEKHDEKHDE